VTLRDTWLEPWVLVLEEHRSPLEDALRAELSRNHALYGRAATAMARRVDNDDVLFAIESPSEFAVVHLTYALHPEQGPEWPATRLFASFDEFVSDCMVPDHEAFTAS
jgi:hypothetical protein